MGLDLLNLPGYSTEEGFHEHKIRARVLDFYFSLWFFFLFVTEVILKYHGGIIRYQEAERRK